MAIDKRGGGDGPDDPGKPDDPKESADYQAHLDRIRKIEDGMGSRAEDEARLIAALKARGRDVSADAQANESAESDARPESDRPDGRREGGAPDRRDGSSEAPREERLAEVGKYRALVDAEEDDRPENPPPTELGGPRSRYDPALTEGQRQERIAELGPNAERAFGASNWSNKRYAGTVFQDYPTETVRKQYPDGVPFSYEGCPQFDRYVVKTVELRDGFKGRGSDFVAADELAGFPKGGRPRGMTWHHHEDGRTMQLLDMRLHRDVRHWGGMRIADVRNNKEGRDDASG